MNLLKQRIQEVGVVLSDQVLKVDAILNHQVDPALIMALGKEFASLYAECDVTKVLTVESSGIPLAMAAAYELHVPFIFARRKKNVNHGSRHLLRASAFLHQRNCNGYYGFQGISAAAGPRVDHRRFYCQRGRRQRVDSNCRNLRSRIGGGGNRRREIVPSRRQNHPRKRDPSGLPGQNLIS